MSLINDVLKDLERRNTAVSTGGGGIRRDPAARRSVRRAHWPFWLMAAVALGAVLHLSLDSGPTSPATERTATLTAQVSAPPRRNAVGPADPPFARPSMPASAPGGEAETELVPSRAQSKPDTTTAQSQPSRAEAANRPENGTSSPTPSPSTDSQEKDQPATESTRDDEESADDHDNGQFQNSSISIRRADNEEIESDSLAAPKRMLARGQIGRAEARLRQLIREQPELAGAYELLAEMLASRGRGEAAAEVLEDGLENAAERPESLSALLGRLLLERGQAARARDVLLEYAPAIRGATDYHLLLAAAHRQAGDHTAAAEHYRSLTEILPRSGAAWIGLGASLESLDQPVEAVAAYRRAEDGDDRRAARFARQRLAALEHLTGEPQ